MLLSLASLFLVLTFSPSASLPFYVAAPTHKCTTCRTRGLKPLCLFDLFDLINLITLVKRLCVAAILFFPVQEGHLVVRDVHAVNPMLVYCTGNYKIFNYNIFCIFMLLHTQMLALLCKVCGRWHPRCCVPPVVSLRASPFSMSFNGRREPKCCIITTPSLQFFFSTSFYLMSRFLALLL